MWKHKNFINLQLCAGEQDELAGTWVFNDTIDTSQFFSTPDGSMYYCYDQDPTPTPSVLVNFNSNNVDFLGIGFSDAGRVIVGAHAAYYGKDNPFMGTSKGWQDEAYKTITITSKLSEVTNGDTLLAWLQANATKQSTPQPTLTFKHFFDAGTIGSGTVKFRHYSQQEPTPSTYTVAITAGGARDSACAYKLWSTADQANPTSGTMVYQNDGRTDETVNVEVDKKYLVIEEVDNDGFRGADFVAVRGSVSKLSHNVLEVSGQGEADIDRWNCLTGDTLITLADLTQKRIDELTLQDKVLAIDSETGKFVADEITYTDSTEHKTFTEYDVWTFSDGTIVKTVHRHRFYNVEKQAMVYMDEWNIGDHAINQNGEYITLVSHENVKEEVQHYTLFTKYQNYFANGLLSGNRHTAELHLKR